MRPEFLHACPELWARVLSPSTSTVLASLRAAEGLPPAPPVAKGSENLNLNDRIFPTGEWAVSSRKRPFPSSFI